MEGAAVRHSLILRFFTPSLPSFLVQSKSHLTVLRRVFKAFQYRDFRLMWIGACTSSIGTWMQNLAQSWLVLSLSKRPLLLGVDAFLQGIPIFLFSLVGGVIADRM